MWFLNYFKSRIRVKVILPYVILTIVVTVIGAYLSTQVVANSVEERFTNQLVAAAFVAADGLNQLEENQLVDLRAIAFTEGIEQAMADSDPASRLNDLLFPLIANKNIDRVDIIDQNGDYVYGVRHPAGSTDVEDYVPINKQNDVDWRSWWIVDRVLNGDKDDKGDKFVTIESIDNDLMFFTAGPLKQEDGQVIGVVLVSSHMSEVLSSLRLAAFADISLYDLDGDLLASTFSDQQEAARALKLGQQAQLMLAVDGESSFRKRSVELGSLEYDVLYNVFRVRVDNPIGFYAVAVQTTYINSNNDTALGQTVAIFAITLLLVFLIGYYTANTITKPVQHLMEDALAVASGDLTRRTKINSTDEIGSLARSLDHMTESLANYTQSLQNRISELVLLYENSTAVTVKSGLNLEHIMRAIAESVKGVIKGTDQVIVYLFDEKKQQLIPRVSTMENIDKFATLPFNEKEDFWHLLSDTKTHLIELKKLKTHQANGFNGNEFVVHALVVSLIASREIIGMLALLPRPNAPDVHQLDEDKERLLVTLANQSAIAIKNAQLFDATQRAYEELRRLDDLKTEFINIAAHELRTPLGAMIGYASFLEKRVPEKLHKSVRFLTASSLRMRTMVDAMLAIQRLDAGTAFLRITNIDVTDIIHKTVVDFTPMAEMENHTIEVNLPEYLPKVPADPEKVGLILSNLISNAIKFTPEGGTIEVSAQDYLKGILIQVKDNGVGISEDDQFRIFERFYQVRPDHLAGHGGMGIGLTIVKHLVELHEGQVWVESEEGEGTIFSFTLPNEPLAEDAPEQGSNRPKKETQPVQAIS
ncbi:MAG: HAMP domain-containing protein [Anaerolineaceae bacterium]|nr:HAMP domain-containing protein [Anaerolineaceae bacterium]